MANPPKAPPPDRIDGQPSYWLMKSEPNRYSWDDLVRDGRTRWDGIRNHQAAIYLRAMRLGDLGLFYHSNVGLEVVGVVEIPLEPPRYTLALPFMLVNCAGVPRITSAKPSPFPSSAPARALPKLPTSTVGEPKSPSFPPKNR